MPRWSDDDEVGVAGFPKRLPSGLGESQDVGVERPAEGLLRGHHQQGRRAMVRAGRGDRRAVQEVGHARRTVSW